MKGYKQQNQTPTLLVGFDSAWTPKNSGALVGLIRSIDGTIKELGDPQIANFAKATNIISEEWQKKHPSATTIVMIDQPTIVKNSTGQRHVENIVSSPVSRRYGGMQPANTSKSKMFGKDAPIWTFLKQFNSPDTSASEAWETYPVLAMIALDWVLRDSERATGRMPKYNPTRKKTFSLDDWQYMCCQLSAALPSPRFPILNAWINKQNDNLQPQKADQDKLDACICLLVALHFVEKTCLAVGDVDSGRIVIPYQENLEEELKIRCQATDRDPIKWIETISWKQP
jgi:predicted RNase H-like nuclease